VSLGEIQELLKVGRVADGPSVAALSYYLGVRVRDFSPDRRRNGPAADATADDDGRPEKH
jgi:hypothetical protein